MIRTLGFNGSNTQGTGAAAVLEGLEVDLPAAVQVSA
jgi:hypothetical protein